ncbi:glycosyltransferase family 2 protein [Methanothrix sp.]|uniref:glycosyltransferase family 2 protein n=1 Tax=Methanothrix sp. TaxID=90426 RepID=UPI002579B700|nr:glycosyltransferase family 2 protein [Methanothrix sp.]NPU87134.1 glycosyltransferase family 2 protein [Methanothrix sp.]
MGPKRDNWMRKNDLVSVVLPAYNAEPYIGQAISSVLQQTYPYFELIVAYDKSSDRTLDIIESFNDPRLRILKHDTNRGPGAARNSALAAARGKWVTFIDADDVWLPERLEVLVPLVKEAEDKFFLADDLLLCFDTSLGLKPWKSQFKAHKIKFDGLTYDMTLAQFLMSGCPGIKPIIPLKQVRSLSIRFSDSHYGEDLEFWCYLFKAGLQLRLVCKAFYLYRLTPNSLTTKVDNMRELLEVYKRLLAHHLITTYLFLIDDVSFVWTSSHSCLMRKSVTSCCVR